MIGTYISYSAYIVLLFLLTGILILILDVKLYEQDGRKKEKKAAKIGGWFNIAMSVVFFLSGWIFNNWFR